MSKYNVYVEDVSVEAVFNRLGGVEGARAFLRGELKLAPFSFERNEHGHIVLTVTGLDLSGEQEVERLIAAGFRMTDWAKSCFTSTKADGYDKNHTLSAGQWYKVVLMPTREIKCNSNRTTNALRKRGIEKYQYKKPLAGILPHICKLVLLDKRMEEMGFQYIAVPHNAIKDCDDNPSVLYADRRDDGLWLHTHWVRPDDHWGGSGAFAFLVPTT